MDFYGLPDQTLIEISKMSPLTWFRICEMVPFMGEWTPSTQRLVRKPFIYTVKNCYKDICHYLNTSLHRDGDLPAIEGACGDKFWYILGTLHRDNDLPDYETDDGDREWWILGKLHRDNDLPTVNWTNGHKKWFINGVEYTPMLNQPP
jgi:hypothetical protein